MMKSADPHTPHSTASLSPAAASLAEAAVILVSVIRRLAREATISFMHDSTGRCMHELWPATHRVCHCGNKSRVQLFCHPGTGS